MIRNLIKNPFTIWIIRHLRARVLEYSNNNLKMGFLSTATHCSFGNRNTVYENVTLHNVKLGDFTYVASGSVISNTIVEKFCSIGPDCKIGLGKHPTRDFVSTHPIFFSTLKQAQISFVDRNYFEEFEKIKIGNDVWIGANVIVIDGINIGDGAIIAAGSVVTKDIPPYAIVGGIPAKIIRYRFENDAIFKLLEIKWWDMDINYLKIHFKKFHNINKFLLDRAMNENILIRKANNDTK